MNKKRKFIGLLLCFVMILSQFTVYSFADDVSIQPIEPSGGDIENTQYDESLSQDQSQTTPSISDLKVDTEDKIYSANEIFNVNSEEDLEELAVLVNGGKDFVGKKVMVTGNIVLDSPWTPIGTNSNKFAGELDGQNNEISQLSIEGSADYQGLFGGLTGTVKNLTVNGSIKGGQYVAGVCAYAEAGAVFENVTNNVQVAGSGAYAAGILAYSKGAVTITNCVNNGNVEGTNYTAGIAGYVTSSSADPSQVKESQNNGIITGDGYVAGIVGIAKGGYETISGCTNGVNGVINGTGTNVAGIIADAQTYSIIENCNNMAAINDTSGKGPTGGIVANLGTKTQKVDNCYNTGTINGSGTYTGGVIGQTAKGNKNVIKYCYNAGIIESSGSYAAGIVGYLNGGSWSYTSPASPSNITYCYNQGKIQGTGEATKIGGIAGLCKDEATTQVTDSYNSGELYGTAGAVGAIAAEGFGNSKDNYYLDGMTKNIADNSSILPVDSKYATSVSPDMWAAGKAAYLLDGGGTDSRKNIWGQEGGNPVFSTQQVYKIEITNDNRQMTEGKENQIIKGENAVTEIYVTKSTLVQLTAKPAEGYILSNAVLKTKDGKDVQLSIVDDFIGEEVSEPVLPLELASGADTVAEESTTATTITPPSYTSAISFTTPTEGSDIMLNCQYIAKPTNLGEKAEITFDANGGVLEAEDNVSNVTKTVDTTIGSRLEKPADPEFGYYRFKGWFEDKECTKPYTFGTVVTKTMTLYAGWLTEADYFDVVFDANGGTFSDTFSTKSIKLVGGDIIVMPEKPSKIGYLFRGWFQDEKCTTPYDFTKGITEATRIYAGWQSLGIGQPGDEGYVPRQYVVSFDANGGYFTIDSKRVTKIEQLIDEGNIASVPASPTRDSADSTSYEFAGWLSSNGSAETDSITSDVTFTAQWTEQDEFEKLLAEHGDSEEDAIQIPDLGTLAKLRNFVNANKSNDCTGKYFILTGSIQLPSDWIGIGTDSFSVPYLRGSKKGFAGNFNGNSSSGYKIYYSNNQSAPLFGAIKGTAKVSNLEVTGGSINGLGGLCDTVANATVENCSVMTTVDNPNNGIAGFSYYCYGGNLINCRLKSGSVLNGGMTAGGITAVITSMGSTGIVGCTVEDGVKINAVGAASGIVYGIGGIVGYSSGKVINCYNGADITATYSGGSKATGGIVGLANSMGTNTIKGCVNGGNITVTGTKASNAGGIFGQSQGQSVNITDCVSFGKIDAIGVDVNAIAGEEESKTIMSNSYYANDNNLSDPHDGKGATGLPIKDFQSGKVAYLIKADAESMWTQNEIGKHPELGQPEYNMLTVAVENPNMGSASLGATAKTVNKTSTSEGELYVPFNTAVTVNAVPKATEIITDGDGVTWKIEYFVQSINVTGSNDPSVTAGGSFEFTTDKTAVVVAFGQKKTKVSKPPIVVVPGDNGNGETPGDGDGNTPGTGDGDGTGTGTGDGNNGSGDNNGGSGNQGGNSNGGSNGNGTGTVTNPTQGNGSGTNSAKAEVSITGSKTSNNKIDKTASNIKHVEKIDKPENTEAGGSSAGGKDTVLKIVADTVRENLAASLGLAAIVIAIIAIGAVRRKRKND